VQPYNWPKLSNGTCEVYSFAKWNVLPANSHLHVFAKEEEKGGGTSLCDATAFIYIF
jgi:hypothetical protein